MTGARLRATCPTPLATDTNVTPILCQTIAKQSQKRTMDLAQIDFKKDWLDEECPRYAEVLPFISGNVLRKGAYQRTFERLVAERCIITGERISVESLPVVNDGPETPFAQFIGVNQHAKLKVCLIADMLQLYDSVGEEQFHASHYRTIAYHDFLMHRRPEYGVEKLQFLATKKIRGIVYMYEHMRRVGGLVGNAKCEHANRKLCYYDLPWAVDYYGTLKIRDGAHRGAVAAYLGIEKLPTLLYRFADTDGDILSRSNAYLRNNFHWFDEQVRAARGDLKNQ
jgi:hypothetical protein